MRGYNEQPRWVKRDRKPRKERPMLEEIKENNIQSEETMMGFNIEEYEDLKAKLKYLESERQSNEVVCDRHDLARACSVLVPAL